MNKKKMETKETKEQEKKNLWAVSTNNSRCFTIVDFTYCSELDEAKPLFYNITWAHSCIGQPLDGN